MSKDLHIPLLKRTSSAALAKEYEQEGKEAVSYAETTKSGDNQVEEDKKQEQEVKEAISNAETTKRGYDH